jgi:hypothetical protein
MLTVTFKPIMLNVFMMGVIMMTDTIKLIMLNVVTLSVIMLTVTFKPIMPNVVIPNVSYVCPSLFVFPFSHSKINEKIMMTSESIIRNSF